MEGQREELAWEGEKKAGLIKSKFDELYRKKEHPLHPVSNAMSPLSNRERYSKHFRDQPTVLSLPPLAPSPFQPQLTAPLVKQTDKLPSHSPIPRASAQPVYWGRSGGFSQEHPKGISDSHSDGGVSTGGIGPKDWRGAGGSSQLVPECIRAEPLANTHIFKGKQEDVQLAGEGDSSPLSGHDQGLGLGSKGEDTNRVCGANPGLQSCEALPGHLANPTLTVAGPLPEGGLPKLSWAQMPDGATVIVVSPNLVANPKVCSGEPPAVSPNPAVDPSLCFGEQNGGQTPLQISPERMPPEGVTGDAGGGQSGGVKSVPTQAEAISGGGEELGEGRKRESEAGEVIQSAPKRQRQEHRGALSSAAGKGPGERGRDPPGLEIGKSSKPETRSSLRALGKAAGAGDVKGQAPEGFPRKAPGGKVGDCSGGENGEATAMCEQAGRERKGDAPGECKPKGLRVLGLGAARGLPAMEADFAVSGDAKPGVKVRSLAALALPAVDRSAERPSKKRKFAQLSGSEKSSDVGRQLPPRKVRVEKSAPAGIETPPFKPLAKPNGHSHPQQPIQSRPVTSLHRPISKSTVPSDNADKPRPQKQSPKVVAQEPGSKVVPSQHRNGAELIGKRRNEALEAMADAASEPVCRICYTEFDAGRCYVACDMCDRWYHADAFSYSPDAAAALKKFKCPTCNHVGRPAGCPIPDPSAALASPLKIRPKFGQQLHVVYANGRLVLGGKSAGLGDPPAGVSAKRVDSTCSKPGSKAGNAAKRSVVVAKSIARSKNGRFSAGGGGAGLRDLPEGVQVERRERPVGSKDLRVGEVKRSVARVAVVARGEKESRSTKGADGKGNRSTETEAPSKEVQKTAQNFLGAKEFVAFTKRPPLRLVGVTHPANLRLPSIPELPPWEDEGSPNSAAAVDAADGRGEIGEEERGPGECAALLAGLQDESLGLLLLASAARLRADEETGFNLQIREGRRVFEGDTGRDSEGGASGRVGEGRSLEPEGGVTGSKQTEKRGGAKSPQRDSLRKRIQPTKLGPIAAQSSAVRLAGLVDGLGTEAAALLEGPAMPALTDGEARLGPAQRTLSCPQGLEGFPDVVRDSSGGPVLPSVGRYSWESERNRLANRASWDGPVLPDRIHTGAGRGQSARWSIDLSKVQEVDGRKVRMRTGEIDGVQQLS